MTQKQLPYDRNIVPQETGYNCGPASAQIVLNSRGIRVDETQLAREIGTTWNGTDFVGLIERVLDERVPEARYTSVQMPNDPPTGAQCNRLWRDILRSIDGGYGVIVNIVAPPSNYPRGVNGSVSPAYGGGTVYHYMTVMGYDDATRAVWIADSGFRPFGYWMSFDQLTTLIPPKGYAYADVDPAPNQEDDMTQQQFDTLNGKLDAILRQLGPWGQLGTNDEGEPLTLVDALAKHTAGGTK
ncbi:C39 family peptidase [Rhodococcus sp. UNC363MFTsu5.1]|uniref:C39 family peptidase n=1 Tax=Rhodococcus sp. UNC363MFTsu5.1 TaxID=1449069 RepID=UPI0009DEBCE4|nr:C39 family peptidase [Rhodococcus sp. UNC363MFTsu5.1]